MNSALQKVVNHSSTSLKLCSRKFHSNTVCCINSKWREEKGLPVNPKSFGPLTNLPDYSFVDNRSVPYGTNQKRRIDEQRAKLVKIKQLVGEIDFAVERYEMIKQQEQERKQQILDSKLKGKGKKLLQNPTKNIEK